jgi:membrane protease subunit HflK
LLILGVVGLGVYLLTGVVQVRPGELAVVRRFGRVLPDKPGPGLWVGLPWGLDRVDRVVVDEVRSVTVGYVDDQDADLGIPPGQVLTGDHNLVNVQVVLFYTVRHDEVADYVLQADRVEELLSRAVESSFGEWVGGRTVDEVLLMGKAGLRQDLLARVRERIEPYRLGIKVADARVAQVAPPLNVKDAFDNVARAQTQMTTQRHQAEQTAASHLSNARAEEYRVLETTAAYVRNQKVLARQEAERFLMRLRQYEAGRQTNPDYLRQIQQEERARLFARLKQSGQLDLLDHHLGPDGLDVYTAPTMPRR